MSEPPAVPLVTLLTDFGSRDVYVGQVKGAILSVCRQASLIDLTHDIPPGNIAAAAIAWADAVTPFPPQTIHVGVVDPGVGTQRRGIAAEIGPWRFVCPDNGLLSGIVQTWPLIRAVELTEPRWWRSDVSSVFHGRDIFGPVAAHWASGQSVTDFGPLISKPLETVTIPSPQRNDRGIAGTVLAIDHFGNLRTNIPAFWIEGPPEDWHIEIGNETIHGLVRCFGDADTGALLALLGSHGRVEVAVNRGNAAERLNASVGTSVNAVRRK
jgi:S-adenosylmethionine hydrolase